MLDKPSIMIWFIKDVEDDKYHTNKSGAIHNIDTEDLIYFNNDKEIDKYLENVAIINKVKKNKVHHNFIKIVDNSYLEKYLYKYNK